MPPPHLAERSESMSDIKYCGRCGTVVQPETDSQLKETYPYYCSECDENMFGFEVTDEPKGE
jgi:NADH pyrophosphatase NudC (nudix superfamily)